MLKYFICNSSLLFLYFCSVMDLIMRNVETTSQDVIYFREMEVMYDLPVKSDFDKYIGALERTLHFVDAHKYYVDLNLSFGIFLTNVHLKNILLLKGQRISTHNRNRLETLVKITDNTLRYFTTAFQKFVGHHDKEEESLVGLVSLFISDDNTWPLQLPKFNLDLLKKTKFYSRKGLERIYLKWPKYQKLVFERNDFAPTAEQSDICLALLAQNPVNRNMKLAHCQIPYNCGKVIMNGTDYGYAITHRLLFMLLARFGRGCALMSPIEDKQFKDHMCAMMYNEAEYITSHDFQLADLLVEIIALATIEGHAQFLRRSWLEELLDFQTVVGCFNVTRPDEENTKQSTYEKVVWQFVLHDHMIMGGTCNAHITSIASAMLGSAVRYVIQNYY